MRFNLNFQSTGPVVLAAAMSTVLLAQGVVGQQQQAPPAASARPPAPPEVTKATANGDAAAVLALEEKIEAATVSGDTAFFSSVISSDFSFVHGDHWATGGKPQIADDRAGYLKRVTDKVYMVHDLDQVKIEMHPDVAITYGRYVSLAKGATTSQPHLASIWFQRVYAKRNGQWVFLSHRTVHGPTPSPGGIDPTTSDNSPKYGEGPVWFLTDPAPPSPPPASADEREILQMDQKVGTAVVKGDVDYVKSITTSDFSMVHGDIWTRGGKASLRDTQDSMLSRVGKSYGVLDFDHIKAEMHGDVAITYGRYLAQSNGAAPERAWFSVWFERVYQKRGGRWIYLSHRTVHGPTYGPDRKSVSDK